MSKLDAEDVKSNLDRGTIGTIGRADAHDLALTEANERIFRALAKLLSH